ncbi:uncharacterized protein LOC131249814 [Magnolia sinica]|uniref:uncharacterized protein LOC131249814 n=1 Tax=Magnolia sinica TaxID=86752 RepID=UPI0026589846|nr:uncharacterized protein LOC131249814 [Magnolia sinica]
MEETEPTFTSTIMNEVKPQRFRIPPVIQYSGSDDPSEHVEAYRSWMQIQTASDAMMCKRFSITLTGFVRSWYRQLKPNSIESFGKLSRLFLTQFISDKKSRKPNTHLFTIKQEPNGLKEGRFTFSLGKNQQKTLTGLIARAQKYTNTEEFTNARMNVQIKDPTGKGKRLRSEESQLSDKGPDDRAPRDRRPSRSHNTADRVDLKDEIETLICKGYLRRYTKGERTAQREEREQPNNTTEEPTEIRIIFGGSSSGGDSNRARKAHTRKSDPEHYVHLTKRPSKELRVSSCSLTFTKDDARKIQHPYDDALVVTLTIANHKVCHILVNTGSSANVIYSEDFEKMGIPRSRLKPVKTALHGFAGERVISEGVISLPVTAGEGQHQATLMVDFLVVNVPSMHNIIWVDLLSMR